MTNQEVEQKIKEEIERCKEHYKKELDSYWLGRIDALNFVSMLNDLKSKDDIIEKPRNKIKLSEIIKNEKMVIHTPKKEQVKALCKRLDKLGLKWRSGGSYLEYTYWGIYKENTCYRPSIGTSADIDFCLEEHYQVIEFKDVDLEN